MPAQGAKGLDADMDVIVNGAATRLTPGTTVLALVTELTDPAGAMPATGLAVAVNDEVVPRGGWSATTLRPGDRVEVLIAAQGG